MDDLEEKTCFCVSLFCLSEDQEQDGIKVSKQGRDRELSLQVSQEGKGVNLVLMDGKWLLRYLEVWRKAQDGSEASLY